MKQTENNDDMSYEDDEFNEYEKVIIPQISEKWLFRYSNSKHDIEWNTDSEIAAINPAIKSAIAMNYFTSQYYNNAD